MRKRSTLSNVPLLDTSDPVNYSAGHGSSSDTDTTLGAFTDQTIVSTANFNHEVDRSNDISGETTLGATTDQTNTSTTNHNTQVSSSNDHPAETTLDATAAKPNASPADANGQADSSNVSPRKGMTTAKGNSHHPVPTPGCPACERRMRASSGDLTLRARLPNPFRRIVWERPSKRPSTPQPNRNHSQATRSIGTRGHRGSPQLSRVSSYRSHNYTPEGSPRRSHANSSASVPQLDRTHSSASVPRVSRTHTPTSVPRVGHASSRASSIVSSLASIPYLHIPSCRYGQSSNQSNRASAQPTNQPIKKPHWLRRIGHKLKKVARWRSDVSGHRSAWSSMAYSAGGGRPPPACPPSAQNPPAAVALGMKISQTPVVRPRTPEIIWGQEAGDVSPTQTHGRPQLADPPVYTEVEGEERDDAAG